MTDLPVPASKILIIDDESPIRRAVINALRGITARVLEADTAARGIDLAAAEQPELVIVDLGLPDQEGIQVCRAIRRWAMMPIVVLSARHSQREKIDLLNAGADDYVTKPFDLDELAARVRAHLRRARQLIPTSASVVTIGQLVIDLSRRMVTRDGHRVDVTPLEWKILSTLTANAGRTLTHRQIFDAVWQQEFGNAQQYLRVHITNLRRKIEIDPAAPSIIVTEPGVGYRVEVES